METVQSFWFWVKGWAQAICFGTFLLVGLAVVNIIEYVSSVTAAFLIIFVYRYQTEISFYLLMDNEFLKFLEDNKRFRWKTFKFAYFHSGFICFRKKKDVTFIKMRWPEHVKATKYTWQEVLKPLERL